MYVTFPPPIPQPVSLRSEKVSEAKPETSVTPELQAPVEAKANEVETQIPSVEAQPTTELPQAPTKLSALIVALVRSDGDSLKELFQKLQSASTTPETKMTDGELSTTLEGLLKVANNPEKLQKAIQELNPNFCANLKVACEVEGEGLKKYLALAAKLLEHGQVIGEYTKASDSVKGRVLGALQLMNASPESVKLNSQVYAATLTDFRNELANLIKAHTQARERASNYGVGQVAIIKSADINFDKGLTALISNAKYAGVIVKADAEKLSADLTAAAKQTKEDPNAAHTLDKYMKMLFTPEGAAVGAMLVPFLASILSGTLGQLPVIGAFLQPILGLSTGIAGMAQQLVQTISMLNQATTSRQVAEMQKAKPPADSRSTTFNPNEPVNSTAHYQS